ncbi:hypothetical protein B0H17DRAFT_1200932 [Mycena rosella]|uniref:Uncharacterized protein n=1 Tax=Mycena rosella TaxID=1033263 RepID=A0AAD7DI51_MYCRO|nr:hypothetical protein B0H17DRAFT_1200932 [Mycena rosella]
MFSIQILSTAVDVRTTTGQIGAVLSTVERLEGSLTIISHRYPSKAPPRGPTAPASPPCFDEERKRTLQDDDVRPAKSPGPPQTASAILILIRFMQRRRPHFTVPAVPYASPAR